MNNKTFIDPRTILVAIPTITGQIHAECMGGLVASAGLFGSFLPVSECSHPSLARNVIAEAFMNLTAFEWLVCIDSDIAFSREDFELLLQPVNDETDYSSPGMVHPTIVTTDLCARGKSAIEKIGHMPADALVCAEYRYKRDDYDVVKMGMGFVRIHRSVFEQLQTLQHATNPDHTQLVQVLKDLDRLADNAEYCQNQGLKDQAIAIRNCVNGALPDPGGGPRLWQCNHKGKIIWDYYPSGPVISQFIPTGEWKGEDHGFFTLCMLAGVIPRMETRTRLTHIGRKGYIYEGPTAGGDCQ